ncbi:pirin-like protein [Thermoproteus uzoniensis 768-20]|uniref:Pirin-like protein n=1 Tax=Thermoproteus uzoniensis (strain 768-20) TaxID=999630 RepID=F2L6C2_THEU7|nr:pirin family protein [Thermoproteus uzoniensis]AEA12518.1 pirin-like protein [Thermoproteus uzoniensis 768-20]
MDVEYLVAGSWTRDGAGVKLYRVFGDPVLAELTDPFLLLDHFGSRYPHEYLAGFPWHPHRGIQTITYLLKGEVHHEDSEGNKGVLGPGDLQWMNAGSGIFHSEMPRPYRQDPEVSGFQLWVNLPRRLKMSDPFYKNLKSGSIPKVVTDRGAVVRLISGRVREPGTGAVEGPVSGLPIPVVYMDVEIPEGVEFLYEVEEGWRTLVYNFGGRARIQGRAVEDRSLLVLSRDGGVLRARGPARFLLLSGVPIGEPIAWRGPIVMNTWEEIREAFLELERGTFMRRRASVEDI